jgi:hypothetical protein
MKSSERRASPLITGSASKGTWSSVLALGTLKGRIFRCVNQHTTCPLLFKHFLLAPPNQGEANAAEKKFFSSENNPSFDTRDHGDDISRRRPFNKEDVAYPWTGVCVAPPPLSSFTPPSILITLTKFSSDFSPRLRLGSDVHFDTSGQSGKAFTHGLVKKILLPFTSTD